MGIGQKIAVELPFLRRYARALSGSQLDGDAAVRRLLEGVLAQDIPLDVSQPVRPQLFRALHRSPLLTARQHDGIADIGISARDQQLILLTAVEGFSIEEAADIVGAPVDMITVALTKARRAIAESVKSRILIIEDEGVIALHIKMVVGEAGHDVVGVARTRAEAVEMAQATQPDVVLADISLADGSSGIDAVTDIQDAMRPTVIFVTAFPERLLTGDGIEPTFLITKPFDPLMLTATIAQAVMTRNSAVPAD